MVLLTIARIAAEVSRQQAQARCLHHKQAESQFVARASLPARRRRPPTFKNLGIRLVTSAATSGQ